MLIIPSVKAVSVLEDGRYTVNFEILTGNADNDSTSIADGYWNKPATVIVENGEITVQTEINQQAWVKDFSTKVEGSFKQAKNVSVTNANTRIDEFKVSSLEEVLESTMHIVVDTIDYDHNHKARFKFFPDTLKLISASESTSKETPAKQPEATKAPLVKEEAPKPTEQTATPAPSPAPVIKETTNPVAQEKPAVTEPGASDNLTTSPDADTNSAVEGGESQEPIVETEITQEAADSETAVEEANGNPEQEDGVVADEAVVDESTAAAGKEGGANRVILIATLLGLIIAVIAFIIFPKKSKQQ